MNNKKSKTKLIKKEGKNINDIEINYYKNKTILKIKTELTKKELDILK